MDLLLLGGTAWLGPQLADEAMGRGWSVTALTRGRTGKTPDGVTPATGDRTEPDGYDDVVGRRWDAVIDTTWQPGQARSAVAKLADAADQWVYVSSAGVYAHPAHPGPIAQAELVDALPDDTAPAEQYPGAKVACEQAVAGARGDDALVARLGLLNGPGDVSDRFGYWVGRFALAGDGPVLVPADDLDDPVQLLDSRDLATWFLDGIEQRRTGTVDAPGTSRTLREVVDLAQQVSGHTGEVVSVPSDWLADHGVEAAAGGPMSLPLWRPRACGYPQVDEEPFRATGAVLRPLEETTVDSLDYEREQGLERERRAGLTREEEVGLVDAWRG